MKALTFLLCMFGVGMMSCSNDVLIDEPTSYMQIKPTLSVDEMITNISQSFIISSTRGTNNEITAYPDDYGGMYIDDNGNLTLLVVGGVNPKTKAAYTLRAGSEGFLMKDCEYSYNELDSLRLILEDFFMDKSNWEFMDEIDWVTLGINTSENRVTVTMDCKIDKIKKFKEKVSSSPLIKFEQSQGKPIGYSREMRPSALITSSYGTGSIGYLAKKSTGKIGIVTAGHVVPTQSILLEFGGEYLDNAENTQVSGKLDAAFVPYQTNLFTFSNKTQYGYATLTKTIGTFVQGTQVKCEGSTSKTVKGGTVKDPSCSVRANVIIAGEVVTVAFSDFIKTTMEVSRGDSGGICYLSSNNNPIGIISCGDSFTYMCKISNINNSFSLSMH